MTGWPPAGESFSISDRASSSARLERAYRRLVKCYPRSFRRENTEEIIAVLLATARPDQRRPSFAEAADLLRGAARMRLGLSRCPRTVLHAVRLMYLGALAEARAAGHLVAERGQHPGGGALGGHPGARPARRPRAYPVGACQGGRRRSARKVTVGVVVLLIAIASWLFLAWANGKGSALARVGAIIAGAFNTAASVQGLLTGDATYAPAATIVSCLVMAIGIAAVVLLVAKPSWPYYAQPRHGYVAGPAERAARPAGAGTGAGARRRRAPDRPPGRAGCSSSPPSSRS